MLATFVDDLLFVANVDQVRGLTLEERREALDLCPDVRRGWSSPASVPTRRTTTATGTTGVRTADAAEEYSGLRRHDLAGSSRGW